MFAREPRLPVDVDFAPSQTCRNHSVADYVDRLCNSLRVAHKFALRASDKRHQQNKRLYDQKLSDITYSPGDDVFCFVILSQ